MAGTPSRLIPIKSPALPLAPTDYARQYVDQVNNISRIFYKQIDNLTNALLSNTGGRFLGMPHGSFYDTTTQSDGANTPNPIQLNSTSTAETYGISVANNASGNPTRVTTEFPGIYNIQFSLQLLNYTTAEDNVTVWFKLNGVDVSQSASVEQVNSKHGTNILRSVSIC